MKKVLTVFLAVLLTLPLFSCGREEAGGSGDPSEPSKGKVLVSDALGTSVSLFPGARVVSCYGSFADCWLLSGGTLVGVTEDGVEEGIVPAGEVSVVGSVKHVNLEQVMALNPDYVILSADLAAHLQLRDALTSAGIPCGYFRVDNFSDYKEMMQQFCAVNGREDLYQTHVLDVEAKIDRLLASIPQNGRRSVLLLRVYSGGMKAKGEDNLAGQILNDLGLVNLADKEPSLLEDLSMEKIIREDPDYIFCLAMGNPTVAEEFFRYNVEQHPAWAGLTAVKTGKCFMLPKDLFHYKPNERWAESYEYLAKCMDPQRAEQ